MAPLLDRLRPSWGYRAANFLRHWIKRTEQRHVALLQLRPPPGLFQASPTTWEDRYPETFAFVRHLVGDSPERRLLSFGCATGEEVFSLRHYFPTARITGLDINPRNIETCRQRLADKGGDSGLNFALAGFPDEDTLEQYDAVFAMAVFRHGGLSHAPARCGAFLRFAAFDRHAAALADRVRPGGVLVMQHANFRFSDSAAAAGFEKLFSGDINPKAKPSPTYGADDHLIPGALPDDGVFRKRRLSS